MFRDIRSARRPFKALYTSNFVVDETVTRILYDRGHRDALTVLGLLRGDKIGERVGDKPEAVAADAHGVWVANTLSRTITHLALTGRRLGTTALSSQPTATSGWNALLQSIRTSDPFNSARTASRIFRSPGILSQPLVEMRLSPIQTSAIWSMFCEGSITRPLVMRRMLMIMILGLIARLRDCHASIDPIIIML